MPRRYSFQIILFLFLGFSSGLPLALTSSTLQFWYQTAGFSLVSLGLLSLLGQPYTFKFLWAPLMDRFAWLAWGRRRGWMLFTQMMIILLLIVMALLEPQHHPLLLGCVALATAFFSASQDIAVDAYRTDSLSSEEVGLGNALYTAGYRIAMLVSGGVVLILAGISGFQVMYGVMAGLMLIGVVATLLAKEPICKRTPVSLREAVVNAFSVFFQKPMAWFLVLFVFFYKLSDAFSLSLLGPFLIRTLHLTLQELGVMYKTVGLISTLVGVFLGGFYLKRLGYYRALLYFGFLQALTGLFFIALIYVEKNYFLLITTIALENITSGLGTIAFLSFLMNLCDHRYTATQFALLTSLSTIGRVYIGPLAGLIAEYFGWMNYFLIGFLLCFPGLFLLYFIRNKVEWPFATKKGHL